MSRAAASFFVVALLLTISPGPDTALVLRASLRRSRGHGLASAAGVNTGVALWAAASAVGATALLTASPTAYDALRLVGGAYLGWLGVQALRAAWLNASPADPAALERSPATLRAAFRTGLATNLLNPKVGIFYITVLPQFVPGGVPVLAARLLLAGIHISLGMSWLSVVSWSADRARDLLRKDSARRWIEAVTGVALISFATRTVLSHR